MVLSRDVKDLNGRILLAAGTELTQKHIRVFKIWAVSEVEIQGVENKDVAAQVTAQVDPACLKEAEEVVSSLFVLTKRSHPPVAELMRLAVLRFLRGDSGRVASNE